MFIFIKKKVKFLRIFIIFIQVPSVSNSIQFEYNLILRQTL